MDDLIAWYRAQLDDDEGVTGTIREGGYEHDIWEIRPSRSGRWSQVVSRSRLLGEPAEAAMREDHQPIALVQSGRWEDRHIARYHPDRMVREINAKRRILDAYAELSADRERLTDAAKHLTWTLLGNVVRTLAAAMDDRPGYQAEWRP